MKRKLWGGRFRQPTDDLVHRINSSLDFDSRLYTYDIQGSKAHCRMLAKQDILSREEASQILEALDTITEEIQTGVLSLDGDYEDIHSLVEQALIDKVGMVGEKLHIGRSRNDQVALDVRMYIRDASRHTIELIRALQAALVILAEKHVDLIMPGYTHLQRAQPVLVAHYLLAHYEMLQRDRERFQDGLKRTNVLPLGSAALAGTTFDLDREMVAVELGFDAVSQNSMDAVSDRDFVLEFLFDASVLMMHLSRLSEELILWSSQEFGFIAISDAFCTGSSIMPQKKNPDLPELVRAKTGRVYGNLFSLLTVLKGLPLTYNKDLQEDKEVLFDTVDTLEICLPVMSRLLGAVSFDGDRLRKAAHSGFLVATDLADYLVRKGTTFRQAHEAVGKIVLLALEQGKELHQLALEEIKALAGDAEEDVFDWLEPDRSVRRRELPGGKGPETVKQRIAQAREDLEI
jgi:argininosuccinate lyase